MVHLLNYDNILEYFSESEATTLIKFTTSIFYVNLPLEDEIIGH